MSPEGAFLYACKLLRYRLQKGKRSMSFRSMNSNDKRFSRRQVIGGIGSGIVAAAATPAFSQNATATSTAQPVQDPTTKYPKPPYKFTRQPWPGLASKMDPPPDHGEKSYKGSGRLMGRKALITGGDSGMGRAAAIAYAREGADVAINYFPTEEPDAQEVIALIRAEGRKAIAIPGDLRDAKFCRSLVTKAIEGLGGLDILVSNAGRQQTFPQITDMPDEEFDWIIKTNIYAPFYIIKTALPHLMPGSTIIATTSEQAYDPSPDLYALCADEGGDDEFCEVAGEGVGAKGDSRQWCSAWACLHSASDLRWSDRAKVHEFWRELSARACWATG